MNDLARNELNGRQIRNAITAARQLAQYLDKHLDFEDLQKVVKISLKFDPHTTQMQGGMNDDERKKMMAYDLERCTDTDYVTH